MIKGGDIFLERAKRLGRAANLPPFVIGAVIVGIGTSLPELVSSLFAVFEGAGEIVAANVVGSNIANILLVVGLSAVASKGGALRVAKDLINLDIPLTLCVSILFYFVIQDGIITFGEGVFLVVAAVVFISYNLFHREDETREIMEDKPKIGAMDFILLIVGGACLIGGAKFVIESVIGLSIELNIATGIISLLAVSVGTSLPELLVSIKAARSGDSSIALGNIFGSNAFNVLAVAGIPALIDNLTLDQATMEIGVPFFLAATLLFIVSGISRNIYKWEGLLALILYGFFSAKLFNLL